MKSLGWIGHEMKLQWRNGFYGVYFIVNLIYLLGLGYVPVQYKQVVATLLLISDPTFLGMIFVGGILLLENNQGIPKGIGVTPLGSRGYILGKVVSLVVVAIITGSCIVVAAGMPITLGQLIGIVLGGGTFTMIGIIIGSFATGINQFVGSIAGVSIVLSLPLVSFFGLVPEALFGWLPTYSILKLITHTNEGSMVFLGHSCYLLLIALVVYKLTQYIVEHVIFAR